MLDSTTLIIQSFLLGIFCSMVVHLSAMFILNKERFLLWYILFISSLIGLIFSIPEHNLQELIPWFPIEEASRQLIETFSGAGVIIFYLMFCKDFVHSEQYKPRLAVVLKYLVIGFTIDLGLGILIDILIHLLSMDIDLLFTLIKIPRTIFFYGAMIACVYIISQYVRSPKRPVRFIGWSTVALICGGLLIALPDHGLNAPLDGRTMVFFFQLMCLIQMSIFATYLSFRSRQIELERLQLKEIDEAKSRFFADVSHEFRTPLTLILGPVSDWLKTTKVPDHKQSLELIFQHAKRLLRLINQILDISKIDEGEMVANYQKSNLVLLGMQIEKSFQPLAKIRKIHLSFHSKEEEIWIRIDPDHLEKIISNLLSNALKFTPQGGEVDLIIHRYLSKKEAIIKVKDSGPGIPKEFQPHIFDRFYQANHSDFRTDLPSTGLGLALTKELVELNKGQISVESNEKGSTFTLSFPILGKGDLTSKTETSKPLPLEIENQALVDQVENLLPGKDLPTILVIEDNQALIAYIKHILSANYEIFESSNGEAGVTKAIDIVPDLIITDVMMPKKDGFQVTKELKANEITSHIPIIILTGKSSDDSKLQGFENDADEYLNKPFDAAILISRIQNLLRNRLRLQQHYSKYLLLKPDEIKVSSKEETFLKKVIEFIHQNLDNEAFTVEELSQKLFMTRTQLFNKLRKLVGKGPKRFIRSYRLQRAKQLLEHKTATIAEITYQVGFKDPAYFSRCFKEEFGYPPSDLS